MKAIRPILLSMLAGSSVTFAVWQAPPACAIPPSMTPDPTLAEQYANAGSVVLAKWVESVSPNGDSPGSTTYEIFQIPRSSTKALAKGMRITVAKHHPGKPGQLTLVLGNGPSVENLTWNVPVETSRRRYNYLLHSPPMRAAAHERLSYQIGYLEDSDEVIAWSAFNEVANAPFPELAAAASILPREALRGWLQDSNLNPSKISLYSLMLGLCGTEDDIPWFYDQVGQNVDDFRIDLEAQIGGYLLLTGDDGLDEIDRLKLKDRKAPFSETYGVMVALRLLWSHDNGPISRERLKQSMRLLLDRPEVSDLVIADLARWNDWSVQDRLRHLYGAEDYNIPSIKRAIVRFMIASTKDVPADNSTERPHHAIEGAKYLEELRKADPKTVNEAEKRANLIRP